MISAREQEESVSAYVEAANRACTDLTPDTRETMCAELREHLLELAREGLDFEAELGLPIEYAAEWRAAAELPSLITAPKRRRASLLVIGVVVGCLVGAGIVVRLNQPQPLTPQMLYAQYAAIVNGQQPGHKGMPVHANARPTGEIGANGKWHNQPTRDTGAVDFPATQHVLNLTCAGHGYLQGSIRLGSTIQPIEPVECTRYGVSRLTFINLVMPANHYSIEITPLSNKLAAFAYSVTEYIGQFSSAGGMDVRMHLGEWTGKGDGVIDLTLPNSTKKLTLRMNCDAGQFEIRNKQLGLIFGGDCAPDAFGAATGTLKLIGSRLIVDVAGDTPWNVSIDALA